MILAFGNRARHGKDTACEAILSFYKERKRINQFHGRRVATEIKRVNFADGLRKEVTEALSRYDNNPETLVREMQMPDWVTVDPNPDMNDPLLPKGKHPKILQWWGTEYRRAQDPDYWVKKWQEQIAGFKGVVVTGDLRFLNEAAAVKQAGGATIKVARLNVDGTPYFDSSRPSDHVSETELNQYNWDFQLIAKTGQAAFLGEQAITLAEYLTALQ